MSATKPKKGRNPGAVDNWLDSIGLYRKNVAYDETCLFRAVSEQLFDCQIHHERVRRDCVEYGREHYFKFWGMLEEEMLWFDHMDLLEKHMVVCGNIEIQLVSHRYDCDVLVFDALRQEVHNVTNRNLSKTLMLCVMHEDHYDVIYNRDHIQNAGFCQSLVYGVLYENVFKIPNVPEIVHGMLYEKEFVSPNNPEVNNNNNHCPKSESPAASECASQTNIAPFPFKIAKALDPTIYRNIEYDSWTEVRREMRLGDWYYGDDNLILGTRCILNSNDETFECYIQEIIKNENRCIVYITKLAVKRTVNYTDLSPEDDAKPWPLPFRFSKNLHLTPNNPTSATGASNVADKISILKNPKKRKDRRRVKSCSETSAQSRSDVNIPVADNINAYVGVPLHMQTMNGNHVLPPPQEVHQPMQDTKSASQHNLLITPDVSSPMPKFTWETPWNQHYVSTVQEQNIWPQAPTTPQSNNANYNVKPTVTSAPATPSVMPYYDNSYQYVYNYPMDDYGVYHSWPGPDYMPPTQDPSNPQNMPVEDQKCMQHPESVQMPDQQNPTYVQYAESPMYEPTSTPITIPERSHLYTNLTPLSPHVEIYSPMVPVIYTHTPEIGMPVTPVPVYTPPVEYMSPTPYVYPPTPPATWYSGGTYAHGYNSQGFIFPVPQQNMPKQN